MGAEVRDRGGDQITSGLADNNKDFAHTLSQGQPLKSPEQRSNMGPLVFEKIKSGYSEENRLRGEGGR